MGAKTIRTELPDGCYHIRHHNGDERWYNRYGEAHRLDGPAHVDANGGEFYFYNGEHHREDGPALNFNDGDIEYMVNGVVPKTILDIVITDQDFDFEMFPSAQLIQNFFDGEALGNQAYRITNPDELVLAILRYS